MKNTKRILAALVALCLLVGMLPLAIFAAPANGTTQNNPFVQGTAGSNSFRIPAMVTLSNGTLVAAADVRWNTTYDGGCLDTMVSRSTDGGKNWSYTFANYLGDNGDEYNAYSTAFIDPALIVTENNTIYMLVDLYPYGVALNGNKDIVPQTGLGFNTEGYLRLSSNSHYSYDYYLKDGKIYKESDDSVVSGYSVDGKFNITGNGVNTNLFFQDSPYKVYRTGFLYLTKSTDQGETWSDPLLINNIKTSTENVCLACPGRGLVTKNGVMVFPVYSYGGSNESQRTGFIYSTDGKNWSRSANVPTTSTVAWHSEGSAVELADGTLRFFFRNATARLCYADYSFETNSWTDPVKTDIAVNSNTELSAISYSKTVDGKQVLLISAPTGPNGAGSNSSDGPSARLNGKIFVAQVNDDNSMTWRSDAYITVNSGEAEFMYSCLTERKDGSIALLYEDNQNGWGAGADTYYTLAFETFDFPLTADENTEEPEETQPAETEPAETEPAVEPGIYKGNALTESVTLKKGAAATNLTFKGLGSGQSLTLTAGGDGSIVTAAVNGTTITLIPVAKGTETLTFTVTENTRAAQVGDTYALNVTVTAAETLTPGEVIDNSTTTVTFERDNDGVDSGAEYIIVRQGNTNYAFTNSNGTAGRTSVTISNDVVSISEADAADLLWTFTGSGTSYTIKNGNYYLYPQQSGLLIATSRNATVDGTATVTIRGASAGWGNYYLRYRNDNFQSSTSNNTSVYLYKKVVTTTYAYTVNAEELENQITAAEAIGVEDNGDRYTDDSWSNFITAYKAAAAIAVNNPYANEAEADTVQSNVNTAAQNLADAIFALTEKAKFPVDLTELAAQIAIAEGLTESDYTASSWKAMESALSAAEALNKAASYQTEDEQTAAQAQIDTAAEALAQAIAALRRVQAVNVFVGGTLVIPDVGAAQSSDNGVVSVQVSDDGTMTVTGLKKGTAEIETEDVVYQVTVTQIHVLGGAEVTGTNNSANDETAEVLGGIINKLTLTEGNTYDLTTADLGTGQYVQWSSDDESIATVDPDTGLVTAVKAADHPATVTATIYNSDGSVAAATQVLVEVLPGYTDVTSSLRKVALYVKEVVDSNALVYISQLSTTDSDGTYHPYMMPVESGQLIYLMLPKSGDTSEARTSAIGVFAGPNEDYALVKMIAGGAGDYSKLHTVDANGNVVMGHDYGYYSNHKEDGSRNTSTTGDTKSPGYWQAVGIGGGTSSTELIAGWLKVDTAVQAAIDAGCDGGLAYTRRNDEGDICQYVSFYSVALPTIEKQISGITRKDATEMTPYQPGMKVAIGDTLHYKVIVTIPAVTVQQEDEEVEVTYQSIVVTDLLLNQQYDITPSGAITEETYIPAEFTVQLTLENFDDLVRNGVIRNTAEVTCIYDAFSAGTEKVQDSTEAAVEIVVDVEEYVVDFGLPLNIVLPKSLLPSLSKISATAAFDDEVVITEENVDGVASYVIHYTPDSILTGTEFIALDLTDTASNALGYGVRIYPATTVYYEDGFAEYTGSWSAASKGTALQTTSLVGAAAAADAQGYGYDAAYEGLINTAGASSTAIGNAAVFTFTGTGVDIYANCTTDSGCLRVVVKNLASNKIVKYLLVDTAYKPGSSNMNSPLGSSGYSLPVASVNGLARGSYEVTVTHILNPVTRETGTVTLDGFRVHGTIAPDTQAYVTDGEDSPSMLEMRDAVLNALSLDTAGSIYAADIAQKLAQVLDTSGNSNHAVILDQNNSTQVDDPQDLLDNGPKNELFLYKGQTLVFVLSAGIIDAQIGLKAPEEAVTVRINGQELAITGSTDMFYKLSIPDDQVITIEVVDGKFVSVTELKYFGVPASMLALARVGSPELTTALFRLGYRDSTALELTLEAEDNIYMLTMNADSREGDTYVFTAESIRSEISSLELPACVDLSLLELEDMEVPVGQTVQATITLPVRHAWDEWVVTQEATPEEQGWRKHTCTVCGAVEEETFYLGDLNGDDTVDGADAMLLRQFVALWKLENINLAAADVNGDGIVDGADAMTLRRMIAG